MFPSKETVDLFLAMCKKDGLDAMLQKILKEDIDPNYAPTLRILRETVIAIDSAQDPLFDAESFATGFLTCFNIFRLQLESELMDEEDLGVTIQRLNSYIDFLEKENADLKNAKHPN